MWVNYTTSMCLLKRNHWPNLKMLDKIFRIFYVYPIYWEHKGLKSNLFWKGTIIMPTFEKVKEAIYDYRRGILLLNLVKITGKY